MIPLIDDIMIIMSGGTRAYHITVIISISSYYLLFVKFLRKNVQRNPIGAVS